jgi:hypothetical protein
VPLRAVCLVVHSSGCQPPSAREGHRAEALARREPREPRALRVAPAEREGEGREGVAEERAGHGT